jgi:hypothetical protein
MKYKAISLNRYNNPKTKTKPSKTKTTTMKKSTLVIAALAFSASAAFAQDLTSKKGEAYLPESGDWSIGIDATPVLNYVGNMFNGNTFNAAPTWNFLNTNQTIIGKMYTSETMAYRGILRIGMTSMTYKNQIADASNTSAVTYPNLPPMKEDVFKNGSHFIGLGGGIEMRRGKTRLQGMYGVDGMLWLSGSSMKYTYGNALSTGGTPVGVSAATTTDFSAMGGTNLTTDAYGNAARVTEWKSGMTFGIGVRGFIGAEYFVLPKLSIGAEFGWGIGYSMTGASSTTVESIGGSPAAVGTITTDGNKSSTLMLDTDRNVFGTGNGSLRLNLHF